MREWHGHSDQILDIAVSRSVFVKFLKVLEN